MTETRRKGASSMEDRFRTVFEFAPVAYYLNDLTGRFVDGNRVAEKITGYGREELIGKNLLEIGLLPPAFLAKAADRLAKNAQGLPTGPDTFVLNRKNGEQIEVEVQAHPVTIGGQPLVLCAARDVTEQKRLERKLEQARDDLEVRVRERTAELQSSEERYRAVIEQSMDCIFIADIKTRRILDANKAFRDKLGYSAEEVFGISLYDFLAYERSDVDANAEEVVRKGSLSLGERLYRRKDGTTIHMDVSVSVISTEDRQVFCVVSRDITDRRNTEKERNRFQEQLLQAQKMEAVGIFAGGLAHDFNNVMTAVLGRTQLARLFKDDPERVERELAEIEKAAESAVDLTRQILLFSRQQPIQKKRLNVHSVIERIEGMLGRLLGEDIKLEVQGPREVWTVVADRGNIEQLVMNLAANARDAMPGGGTLRVHVWNMKVREDSELAHKSGRSGRFVRISVSDEGTGMDDETLARIFDPFFTTKAASHGTGLGLAIVHGIVEQHGGWIDVDSTPGEGTDFRVYLPATPDLEPDEETGEFFIQRFLGKGEHVLLVEDEDSVRDFAVKALRLGNYEVTAVTSAEEAIAEIEKDRTRFHLVFSDVVMPGMSGVDLASIIGDRWPDLGILLCSGYTDQKAQWQKIVDKGYPFLSKPYDVPALMKTIRRTLKR